MEFGFGALPTCLAAHTSSYVCTVGCVDGRMGLLVFEDSNEEKMQPPSVRVAWQKKFKQAVRGVCFHPDGLSVFAISRNRALCQRDTESGKKMRCIRMAHRRAPYALHAMSDTMLATGDERGECSIWDWRCSHPRISHFTECADFISDFASDVNRNILLLTSGRRVACGGATGYLELFKWNEFDTLVERAKTGHKDTVEDICVIDDNRIVTASLDGTVRLMNLYPNKMIAVVGVHDDGVEAIDISYDNRFLLSCGHDELVKIAPFDSSVYSTPKKHLRQRGDTPFTKDEFQNRAFFSELDTVEDD
ncbi:WD repeat containing protein 55 [Trichuris trichiura]|uniref:WD repeat-containing protein 55 homolog n=1 Tax=Trichuris trichiura TaxID=36087 RepID=A0A077Z4A3_TRITR|nr:WD repeat containing protein 55 [Trichuris trichiura]